MQGERASERGSALLVVVIIMTIAIMMGSIMFSYSLRNLRLIKEVGAYDKAGSAAQAGVSDAIEDICSRIDSGLVIADGSLNNSNLFPEDPNYSYSVTVMVSGYPPSEFETTSSQKGYIVPKSGVGNPGVVIPDPLYSGIAIQSVGSYKDSSVEKKVTVDVYDASTPVDAEEDHFIIVVHNCKE